MIAADVLPRVVERVGAIGLSDTTVATLRQEWPGIHFTLCSEDDIPARLNPVAEGHDFGIYLVSNSEHCVAFTDHVEAASGIVLATRSDD